MNHGRTIPVEAAVHHGEEALRDERSRRAISSVEGFANNRVSFALWTLPV